MYYTYVLQSKKDGKWYTGYSIDLRKRLADHNQGKVFSTKGRGPFIVIYYEACLNAFDARQREKYFKSGPGKRYLKNRLKRFLSLTGFTLIEAIIYIAIVSFILVALINIADIMRQSRVRFIISNTTNLTAARVLNTVDALVRNADGFVATSAGEQCVFNNKLWLYFSTSSVPYLPSGCMGDYTSGAVSIEPYQFTGATSTSPDSPRYAAEGYGFTTDSKYIYSVGSLNNGWHVSKRYLADMLYDTGFGTNGAISTSGNYGARDVAQDGQYLYIVGGYEADATTNSARIEKRRITDGSLVTSFGTEGVVTSTNAKIFKGIVIDSTYLYVVGYKYNSGTSQNDWVIEKRSVSTGALDTTSPFDTDGVIDGFANGTANDVALDTANAYLYIVGNADGYRTVEKRLATTGAYVTAFNTTGYRQTSDSSTTSSGPNYPATAADDSSVGFIAWSNIANIKADDAAVAQANLTATDSTSHYAKGTNFNFSIPTSATIVGIVLEVKKKMGTCTAGTSISDNAVYLVKNGSVSGNNKQSGTAWPSGTATYATHGGAADLWGLTVTPADVNATDFGAVVQAAAYPAATCRAQIDAMRITVYYATSSGTYTSVTMDATATTTSSVTLGASADSHMKGVTASQTKNYGAAQTMLVGKFGTTAGAFNRPLIKFDLSGIPTDATINSASMTLTLTGAQATSEAVNAYALKASWDEGTGGALGTVADSSWTYRDYETSLSWTTGGADDTTSDRYVDSMGSTTVASAAAGTQYSWTLDIALWVGYPATNLGMVLIGDEATNSTNKAFATKEYTGDASYKPSLTVYYSTAPPVTYLYLAGDNGSDLIVSKINTADGTLDSGFGSSGIATAASATTAGYGITATDKYIFAVGHSGNDWYIEKRDKVTGALVPNFGTQGSITDSSNTDIPYGGVLVDENYMYILGTTVVSATRYQYVEKRSRSSGSLDERHGLRLLCYQDYPNQGKAASCSSDPPHSDVSRQDLTDPTRLFVGLTDFAVTTTTLGSRDAFEVQLNIKYLGQTGLFGIATTSASTTATFRIDP